MMAMEDDIRRPQYRIYCPIEMFFVMAMEDSRAAEVGLALRDLRQLLMK